MGADDAHKGLELINEGSAHRAWHSDRCGDGLPTLHESFEVRYGRLTSLLGEMEDIAKDTRRSSTALLRVSSVCARTVHRSGGFSWRQWRECRTVSSLSTCGGGGPVQSRCGSLVSKCDVETGRGPESYHPVSKVICGN
jgi:hypothetical protein